jgi:hypothetical protein
MRRATIAFLLASVPSLAAAGPIEDQQIWVNVTAIGSLKDRLIYFAELQPRTGDGAERVSQVLLRGALGWQFSKAVSLYGGYAHVESPVRNGPDTNEERFFTQLTWQMGTVAGGSVSTRTRLEHRRLSTGGETGWRVRSMLRYVHPITRPDAPRALVWAEPFVAFNDTDWGARSGFDQLRSFAGLEVPLPGKSTIEVGYLNQAVNAAGPRNRMNHVASLTIFIRP